MTSATRAVLPLAVLAAVLLSAVAALVQAPYVTGDEPPHIDYAYQVWRGEFPVFEDGLEHRPPGAFLAPVQWTAQHPPLFYLLVAPIVGPLAEAGHSVPAVYAARAVNVVLSGVLVLVAYAAARRVIPGRTDVAAVVAFVVAAMATKSHMGGSGYNDLLAATLVMATFAVGAGAIRRGLDARAVLALSALTSLAALTRLSAGIIAVVIAGVVTIAAGVRAWQRRGRWAPVVGLMVGGPAIVLAAAGWFYLRNAELTGTITGARFDWSLENQPGRLERSVADVVLTHSTWLRMPNFFWWGGQRPPLNDYLSITMMITGIALLWIPVLLAARWALRRIPGVRADLRAGAGTRGARAVDQVMLGVLLTLPVIALIAMQIEYRTNAGQMYPRYLLPVALPICLAIAIGLASRPRLLIPIWTAITLADFTGWVIVELRTPPVEPWYYTEAPVPSVVVAGLAVVVVVAAARRVRAATATQIPAPKAAAAAATVNAPSTTN